MQLAKQIFCSTLLLLESALILVDEAIYFEHKGKESGIVSFTFEMIEGLKIVFDEAEHDGSPQ